MTVRPTRPEIFSSASPIATRRKRSSETARGKGVCANFLSLATDPAIDADYFAFSDQDDVWYKDKLQRALTWLVTVPDDVPALYCGRTELVSNDGRSYGFSPLFTRPIAFRNALIQSLGGGNTMVFNKAAKRLLETTGRLDVVLHDWWMYQLVSAVGGAIRYDPQPALKYRQHPDNLIGSNRGWRARLVRIRMMLSGRFRDWNTMNIAALQHVPAAFDQAAKPRDACSCSPKRGPRRCLQASLLSEAIRRLPPDPARQYRPDCGNDSQKDLRWARSLRSTMRKWPRKVDPGDWSGRLYRREFRSRVARPWPGLGRQSRQAHLCRQSRQSRDASRTTRATFSCTATSAMPSLSRAC